MQNSFTNLKICALPIHPSLPTPNPWQPLIFFFFFFTVSVVLPFPECHTIGILQYIAGIIYYVDFSE